MKKNRLPFSALSIEPNRPTNEEKKSTRGPNTENRSGERKKVIKSSTYQYTKKNYGRSRSNNNSFDNKNRHKNLNDNKIPQPGEGVIRIIPLGGAEEIGKNMTAIEIGDDIIVIEYTMSYEGRLTG